MTLRISDILIESDSVIKKESKKMTLKEIDDLVSNIDNECACMLRQPEPYRTNLLKTVKILQTQRQILEKRATKLFKEALKN